MFNNYVGFGSNAILSVMHHHGSTEFDLFGRFYYAEEGGANKPIPMGLYYVVGLVGVSFFIIIVTFIYLLTNKFVYNEKFIKLMGVIYGLFFGVSIFVAVLNTQ